MVSGKKIPYPHSKHTAPCGSGPVIPAVGAATGRRSDMPARAGTGESEGISSRQTAQAAQPCYMARRGVLQRQGINRQPTTPRQLQRQIDRLNAQPIRTGTGQGSYASCAVTKHNNIQPTAGTHTQTHKQNII